MSLDPARYDWDEQLRQVENLASLRSERVAEIEAQLNLHPGMWGQILPLGPQRTPATLALMTLGMMAAAILVHRIKLALDVARPHERSPRVQPMIATPAFGAFPSGHATEAHAMSALLGRLVQPQTLAAGSAWAEDTHTMLLDLARRVAENREVAGVHYPADSEAGADLGQWLAGLMQQRGTAQAQLPNAPLQRLWAQAQAEWRRPAPAEPGAATGAADLPTGTAAARRAR